MKLKLTALALLGLSHVASASIITPYSSENSPQPNNNAKSAHMDDLQIERKKSKKQFYSLVKNPSKVSAAAVHALENQNLFTANQLYLFAQMLFKVGQDYIANILLEQIINTKTNNTSPALLLKIAEFLKSTNPILSAEAYSDVTQNPEASENEKSLAETEYRTLKNLYPYDN